MCKRCVSKKSFTFKQKYFHTKLSKSDLSENQENICASEAKKIAKISEWVWIRLTGVVAGAHDSCFGSMFFFVSDSDMICYG